MPRIAFNNIKAPFKRVLIHTGCDEAAANVSTRSNLCGIPVKPHRLPGTPNLANGIPVDDGVLAKFQSL